jgi:hypothetical protein
MHPVPRNLFDVTRHIFRDGLVDMFRNPRKLHTQDKAGHEGCRFVDPVRVEDVMLKVYSQGGEKDGCCYTGRLSCEHSIHSVCAPTPPVKPSNGSI